MGFDLTKFDTDSKYYEEVYDDIASLIKDAKITKRNYPNFDEFVDMLRDDNNITGNIDGSYTYSRDTAYDNLFIRDRYTIYIIGDLMRETDSEKWFCEQLSEGNFEAIDCFVRSECVYPVLEYIYEENGWNKSGSRNPIDLSNLEY